MLDTPEDAVRALADPALDALFHRPLRNGVESAWYGHVPFAGWIVQACAPRLMVELGTHTGVSYAALCDAVRRNGLPTRCFAVDTWQGDEHAGRYDEAVFAEFSTFHDRHFADFSTLMRMTFDAASTQMPAGSIDLLHIDGLHAYEAVRHDFETWKPLLSDRAVVMFHDTCVRERGFGVWRVWQELRAQYPGFEFLHGHGLGVLAVGSDVPRAVAALCVLSDDRTTAAIRARFAMMGERCQAEEQLRLLASQYRKLETAFVAEESERRKLQLALIRTEGRQARTDADLHRLEAQVGNEMRELRETVIDLQYERQRLMNSTLWRMMAPLRRAGERVPVPVRRALRMAARVGVVPLRLARRRAPAQLEPLAADAVPAARLGAGGVLFISGESHTPGHIYRVLRQMEVVVAAGRDAAWMRIEDADRRMDEIACASIVVVWRAPWSDTFERIVETVRANSGRLVFDVDDLMFRPELATLEVIDGIRSQGLDTEIVAGFFAKIRVAMATADACSCTTLELARDMRQAEKIAFVLPNGFDAACYKLSRLSARRRAAEPSDGLVRIGYAAGSRTHQHDFAMAAGAIARLLRDRPHCRLVFFETVDGTLSLLDVDEFAAIDARPDQIEWRKMVPLAELPTEVARFDINIAPLQHGNPFCEAKSELKYFEAALVDVPTVASPTGPIRRAMRDGETGMLAATEEEWYRALIALVDDADLRRRMGRAAHLDVLWPFGPERREQRMLSMLRQVEGSADSAAAFALELARESAPRSGLPALSDAETVFAADAMGEAEVTVVVPLFNYAGLVAEALESVAAQTLDCLDLVIVDDASTDSSLAVAREWVEANAGRFNRILLLRNRVNAGLARTRNAGFAAAETPFVLPLDADNRLLPECCARTLKAARAARAAFAYPEIRNFGGKDHVIGVDSFVPMRLAAGNYIDAMALVAKSAWAAVGGYAVMDPPGWEDYDFWCRFAELGLPGVKVAEVLAEYRVHEASMLHTTTDQAEKKQRVIRHMEREHGWLSIAYRG
jgi:GT2 family glycosyltransferase/glycosyltransferase involved in cell wall biosynthesis